MAPGVRPASLGSWNARDGRCPPGNPQGRRKQGVTSMAIDVDSRRREDRRFDGPAGGARMPGAHLLRRGWRFLLDGLIQSVPEEDALCEFDCRNEQCTMSEWSTCERRLQAVAAQLRFSRRPEPSGSPLNLGPRPLLEPQPACPSIAPSSPDRALAPILPEPLWPASHSYVARVGSNLPLIPAKAR